MGSASQESHHQRLHSPRDQPNSNSTAKSPATPHVVLAPSSPRVVTKKAKKKVPAVKTKQYKNKLCNFEGGCNKHAKNGGVCQRHGAKVKFCSFEGGCDKEAKNGGVCRGMAQR